MQFGNKSAYAENRDVKVSVSSLTKRYGDLLVLDDINFDIYKGEMLCIVGPTGCGKTTFLNCLSRFIPITNGSIEVDGIPADPKVHNIAFVFQEVSAIPWLTVEDNIRFGLRIKCLAEDEIERRVERMSPQEERVINNNVNRQGRERVYSILEKNQFTLPNVDVERAKYFTESMPCCGRRAEGTSIPP